MMDNTVITNFVARLMTDALLANPLALARVLESAPKQIPREVDEHASQLRLSDLALEELSQILRQQGITYDELMAEVEKQRERTIQAMYPGLETLYNEVNPNAESIS